MTATTTQAAIRPFSYTASDKALDDLRRRINATQWPEQETVTDDTQGVRLATMQQLARYWATEHDWRKAEAKLNALPQFITEIDGLDIHFIHVQSPRSRDIGSSPWPKRWMPSSAVSVTHGINSPARTGCALAWSFGFRALDAGEGEHSPQRRAGPARFAPLRSVGVSAARR